MPQAPSSSSHQDPEKIHMMVVGGLEEVGKNMVLYEYRDSILIIDCGLKFATPEHPGVDYLVNDFSYLERNRDRIVGMVITHAHLDHIGAIPVFQKQVQVPMWATPFTKVMIDKTMADKAHGIKYRVHEIKPGKSFEMGPFNIEPIHVNHSIPDSVALAINTEAGTILHSGDFRIDEKALYEKPTDLDTLKRYGKKGILALVSDSTNAVNPGNSLSESVVSENLEKVLEQAPGRVILATFASQIHRIQKLLEISNRTGRKIFMTGRSMVENTEAAMGIKQFRTYENMIIVESELKKIQPNKVLILATGSQGEETAGLSLISQNKHKVVRLQKDDTIVFSSSVIPGNERGVNKIINRLVKEGMHIVTNKDMKIHSSGHGYQEELKQMLEACRPKFFIPFHGESMHLEKHKQLAVETGMNVHNVSILENGWKVEITPSGVRTIDKMTFTPTYVEFDHINGVNDEVLEERLNLGKNGMVIFNVRGNERGISEVEILAKGFVHRGMREDLFEKARKILVKVLQDNAIEIFKDRKAVEQQAKKEVRRFLEANTSKYPSVYVFLSFQVGQAR